MSSVNPDRVKSSATLGFIGSIFYFIPFLDLVGLILVLVSLRDLSREYGDPSIWRNAIYAIISSIIGTVVLLISIFLLMLPFYASSYSYSISGTYPPATVSSSPYVAMSSIGILVAVFVVAWVIGIVYAYFIRRAFSSLADRSGIANFKKAGNWYWWGALLEIVIVGAILSLIALIFQIIGFNDLRNKQ